MPDIPDLQQVGGATSQDEAPEHAEDPIEKEKTILADVIDEDDGNAVIRKRDQAVGDDVQPHDPRIPAIAETVRHEISRQQWLEESHEAGVASWVASLLVIGASLRLAVNGRVT